MCPDVATPCVKDTRKERRSHCRRDFSLLLLFLFFYYFFFFLLLSFFFYLNSSAMASTCTSSSSIRRRRRRSGRNIKSRRTKSRIGRNVRLYNSRNTRSRKKKKRMRTRQSIMCTLCAPVMMRHDQSLIYQLSLKDAPNCASRIFEKCTTLITRVSH